MSGAYERFRALHEGSGAFVMPNPWDGASAVPPKRAGFPAPASTSLGVAFALGRPDGLAAVSRAEAMRLRDGDFGFMGGAVSPAEVTDLLP